MKTLRFLVTVLGSALLITGCGASSSEKKTENKEVNDKTYSISEITGNYEAVSEYSNGTTYNYYLQITESSGYAYSEYYTFEGQRLGLIYTHDLAKGAVSLTEKNISIGDKTGFIRTENGKIEIHICEKVFTK